MKAPEAIVLAGGFGTRLGELTRDTPKPMLPMHGRPFLEYVLQYLGSAGVERAILSVGYQREKVRAHFGATFLGVRLVYCEEETALGTGGAIVKAAHLAGGDHVLVTNGDTYFPADINILSKVHFDADADVTMALKQVPDASRYGGVAVQDGRVTRFLEKGLSGPGVINGGVYMMRRALLLSQQLKPPYSFEHDVLEKQLDRWRVYGIEFSAPFVDIGVPEDYLVTARDILPPIPQ